MTKDDIRTPKVAIGAACVRCGKSFNYYIWLARGQNKTSGDFEIPKLPVCHSCRSRVVETDIRKTHVRGG